jgi:hypothetical protein
VVKLSSTIKVDSEKQCLNETLYRRWVKNSGHQKTLDKTDSPSSSIGILFMSVNILIDTIFVVNGLVL